MTNERFVLEEESFSQQLSRETANQLYAFYSGITKDNVRLRENLMVYVNEFIQIVIAQALADFDYKATKKEQLTQVFNNFTALTESIQNQVAMSFTQAMQKYAGQKVNYFCVIKRVQDPLNVHPC
jgi:predicted hydrolase (HD superfamily)